MFFAPRLVTAVVPVVGALLAPGKRTVTAALRLLGLAQHPRFDRYPQVLNRATWSGLAVSRILLGLLVTACVPEGPVIIGIDETLERRCGAKTVRRWHPKRAIVAGSHSTDAALDLLAVWRNRPYYSSPLCASVWMHYGTPRNPHEHRAG